MVAVRRDFRQNCVENWKKLVSEKGAGENNYLSNIHLNDW